MIAIDFDYREEFIYWIDSSRPNGSRINRMCLNGSDIKVTRHYNDKTVEYYISMIELYRNFYFMTVILLIEYIRVVSISHFDSVINTLNMKYETFYFYVSS